MLVECSGDVCFGGSTCLLVAELLVLEAGVEPSVWGVLGSVMPLLSRLGEAESSTSDLAEPGSSSSALSVELHGHI